MIPVIIGTSACSNSSQESSISTEKKMSVQSSGLKDGIWEDRFGGKGSQVNDNKVPNYSIPFEVLNKPKGTKTYALILEDRDAYEVTKGITWIHWVAANITTNELQENASVKEADKFIQGINSWMTLEGGQQSMELSSFYGGMCPPNKEHTYTLRVYALDRKLPLKNGFFLNQMYDEMKGHILESATLDGLYPQVK